ncbi:MAG: GYD domain superfamily [Thermoprotei archaeon]|nr:MAG: GYD domain superfamily [Thermoprotei archaeon]RLF14106.1 MAG: GYD domain superfamily [Thermoprotei archaeon]
MPFYVMLTKLTSEGRETVKDNPKRILEVNKEIEAMGVKVLSQFLLLGPYDFVNIIEAPDNETVAKVAIELGARGTIDTLTMPAIPIEKLIERLSK